MNLEQLNKIMTTSMNSYTPEQIVINLLVTFVLSLLIFWTYKHTYTGVLYTRSFNITIMLITLVTSMVIMIISGNLVLSLGMVGALSIIRFRSAIKDPKDIGFLFWGIGVGLATGTGAYLIAVLSSIVIAIIMVVVHIKKFDDSAYLLIVRGSDMDYQDIDRTVADNTKRYRLRMRNTLATEQEIIYEIKVKKDTSTLISLLEKMDTTDTVHLVTYNGEVNN